MLAPARYGAAADRQGARGLRPRAFPRSGVPLSVCCSQQTELPICCLQQTEAHLVRRAFAPEDVARLEEAGVHEGLLDRGVVERAADVDDVANIRVHRVLEVVRV